LNFKKKWSRASLLDIL